MGLCQVDAYKLAQFHAGTTLRCDHHWGGLRRLAQCRAVTPTRQESSHSGTLTPLWRAIHGKNISRRTGEYAGCTRASLWQQWRAGTDVKASAHTTPYF